MGYEYIDVQEVGGVLVITMDDAPTRNAIGDEMAAEINAEIERLEASATLRALVLTGRDPSFLLGRKCEADESGKRRARRIAKSRRI